MTYELENRLLQNLMIKKYDKNKAKLQYNEKLSV